MTKVANLLYITQPSLTKRLQHMETEFQVTIVNRTPKGLEFTPEGEFLAQQAEKYLKFLHDTQEKLKEFKETTEAEILVGSSYTYSKYTLTDLLLKYRMNHPNVNFTVVNDQSNVLFRKMLEGSIDVAFIRGDYEIPVRGVAHVVVFGIKILAFKMVDRFENRFYFLSDSPKVRRGFFEFLFRFSYLGG